MMTGLPYATQGMRQN